MGQNQDLRRRMVACQEVIDEHQNKISRERLKPHPDEPLIAHWQHEIDVLEKQVVRLMRRLKREW